MKARLYFPRESRQALIRAIRDPSISLNRLWQAFRSLPPEDRDCLAYVPRLLALES